MKTKKSVLKKAAKKQATGNGKVSKAVAEYERLAEKLWPNFRSWLICPVFRQSQDRTQKKAGVKNHRHIRESDELSARY